MSMKIITPEQEHLVLDNRRLVNYLVQKMGVNQKSSEYEDIVSIGTIGLIKAAITFDTSKDITFSTYASNCINNEIFMHYQKANKYVGDISLYAPIGDRSGDKTITIGDTIEDPESNFVEEIQNKEVYIQLVSFVLNCLKGKQRIAFLYLMADRKQNDIAEKLNLSQGYVSRIETEAIQEFKRFASQPVQYKEVYRIATIGDEYRISFPSKDISNFNEIFATFLKNLTSVENLPDFKVKHNKERIIIQVPAHHPESFALIAEIIQLIDETISDSEVERESQAKQVRDYMLSMSSSFTVNDLILHFPNMNVWNIRGALKYAKSKGLITAIRRGIYVVNKN